MSGSSTPSDATMPGRDDDARLEAVLEGETPASPTPLESRIAGLVAASRHPGSDDELAGLDAALTAFATGPSVSAAAVGATADEVVALATASGGARSRRRLRRAGAVGIAGVVLLGSATAAAAAGGHLPRPLQQIAHSAFGAPAPEAVATATVGGSSPRGVGTTADPSGSGATARPGATTPAGTPAGTPSAGSQGQSAAGLCRAWRASGGPASDNAAVVRVLVRLAGSREAVPAYCAGVLATAPGTTAQPNGTGKPSSPPGKPTTTPKPNGNGNGNGNGKPTTPPGKPTSKPTTTKKPKPTKTPKPTATPTPKGTGKPSSPPGKPTKSPKPTKSGTSLLQP